MYLHTGPCRKMAVRRAMSEAGPEQASGNSLRAARCWVTGTSSGLQIDDEMAGKWPVSIRVGFELAWADGTVANG